MTGLMRLWIRKTSDLNKETREHKKMQRVFMMP